MAKSRPAVQVGFERAVGYTARRRVGRVGARRLAEDRDSGVRRGGDILIALCLGAQFVFFGRPTLYGAAGVKKAVDILRGEIDLVMGQIGCPRLDQLGPDFLWRDDWPRISDGKRVKPPRPAPAGPESWSPSRATLSKSVVRFTGDRGFESFSLQRGVSCEP